MTFLDDYSRPQKRLNGKGGWPFIVGAGLVGIYFLGSANKNKIVTNKPTEVRNLSSLEELVVNYENGLFSFYNGLERDTTPEAMKKVLNDFENLPKEKRYRVLGNLLKNQTTETAYGVRDYAEQNLDELIFFLFGGSK
tara:strand:- start:3437 stop:3850 length:414 start_codon:yes stop_codon:yes gene_type:complete